MRRAIGVSGGLVLGTRGCSNVVGIIRRVCDEMIASGGRAEANSAVVSSGQDGDVRRWCRVLCSVGVDGMN